MAGIVSSPPQSPSSQGRANFITVSNNEARSSSTFPIKHFPPRPHNTFSDSLRLSASLAIEGKMSAKPINPIQGGYPNWVHKLRVWLYILCDDAGKSATSVILSFMILVHIAASVLLLVVSTVHSVHAYYGERFFALFELYFLIVFTIEFVVRFWVSNVLGKRRLEWILQPMNIIDLAAILPNYILYITVAAQGFNAHDHPHSGSPHIIDLHVNGEAVVQDHSYLAALRALRILRVFKLTRYSAGMRLFTGALAESSAAFQVLGLCLFITTFLFGTLFHYFESGACPDEGASEEQCANVSGWLCCVPPVEHQREWPVAASHGDANHTHAHVETLQTPGYVPVQNGDKLYYDASQLHREHWHHSGTSSVFGMWFVLVSFTGVGYGDVTPHTFGGYIVGGLSMLLGIIVIALPVAVVGQKFQVLYALNEAESAGEVHRAIFPEDDAEACQTLGLQIRDIEQHVIDRKKVTDELRQNQRILLEQQRQISLLCGYEAERSVRRKLGVQGTPKPPQPRKKLGVAGLKKVHTSAVHTTTLPYSPIQRPSNPSSRSPSYVASPTLLPRIPSDSLLEGSC